jgi:hypothetical protein
MNHSHVGNNLFPRWEHFIPMLGTNPSVALIFVAGEGLNMDISIVYLS